jgi:enoyl-CoA hydratase
MEYQNILFDVKDKIASITVNRPDKLNALNDAVINELFDVFYQIKKDASIWAVLIRGAGERAFVAGADIRELAELDSLSAKAKMIKGQALFNSIETLGKPVLAAVHGYALGGGCELAMACSFRFVSEDAKLGQPEVNLGIIPGYGGTQRLSRLIGKGRALELILSGEMISAAEAYRLGLVNRVLPKDKLIAESEDFLRKIVSKGPLALKAALEAVNYGMEQTLSEGLNLEANLFGLLYTTEDTKEGLAAFLEKRPPKFQGK